MVDFTIPPEAVEAAMRAYPKLTRDEAMWIVGCALKAWPGMEIEYMEETTIIGRPREALKLPITGERQ